MATLKALKKAAEEFNEMFGLTPPIDLKLTSELEAKVKEAMELIAPEDKFTKETQKVIAEYTPAEEEEEEFEDAKVEKEEAPTKKKAKGKKIPVAEEEEEEEDFDGTLEEEIEDAGSIELLKEIIKREECLKGLRKGLGLQKNFERLQARMVEAIAVAEPEKKTPKPKEAKPAAEAEKPTKSDMKVVKGSKSPEKEEAPKKAGKKVGKPSSYLIGVAVAKNPEITMEELYTLNSTFETPLAKVSVGVFRQDMLKARKILKELGLLYKA